MNSKQQPLKFDLISVGHISITVPDLDEAIIFYENLLGAIPLQYAPHFINNGWARNLGISENSEEADVGDCFIVVPNINLFIELLRFYIPQSKIDHSQDTEPNSINGIRHFSIRVSNLDAAFEHVKSVEGTKILNTSEDFKPSLLDPVTSNDILFVDEKLENNFLAKQHIINTLAKVRFFLFSDPYGVVWEFEGEVDEPNYMHEL